MISKFKSILKNSVSWDGFWTYCVLTCWQRAHSERFPAVYDVIDSQDPVILNTLIDQVRMDPVTECYCIQ